MSHLDQLPAVAVDFAVALLLPLILPFLTGDPTAADALARRWLGAYHPVTERELQFVGEAVGYNLKGLTLLAASAAPDLTAEATDTLLRRACSLSRLGHQAQRRLDELRGVRRTGRRATPGQAASLPDAAAPDAPDPAAAPQAGDAPASHVALVEVPDGATPDVGDAQPASSPDVTAASEGTTREPATDVEQAKSR